MWLDAFSRLVGLLADLGASGPATGTGALVSVLLIAVLAARLLVVRPVAATGVRSAAQSVRTRAERAGVPRHRDPDARGRTRPRGPTSTAAAVA
ncbi:DUF6412 domain-containing protein [Actinoplanes sp. N902-109]|uniref:DUF6412 domain-containing protein n=1 Tax=Actinoplanes sp. (strain N902-109) TaxID=649831 RepID=UPI0003293EA0|nr:DUF6412 domain-containing protein [Actinoplanes sp. N902-109]AGL17080.1 hypothetical protein L083_3570 [Actinoplanes sp. N902-109]